MRMEFDTREYLGGLEKLGKRALPAMARAINRSAGTTSTYMARQVSTDIGLPVTEVKRSVKVDQARPFPAGLRAKIEISGKRIPLIKFKAKGPEPSRGRGRGVTAKLPGGRGRYPSAFIATMKSGHRGVFARSKKVRLPVTELRGPSLPHVFAKHIPEGLLRGEEAMQKNLAHELRFAMKQSNG